MLNSRPKKRQRRPRFSRPSSSISAEEDDSDSSFTGPSASASTSTTSSKNKRRKTTGVAPPAAEAEEAEEALNFTEQENSNDSTVEYRTRSGRKSSYRVGVTITRTSAATATNSTTTKTKKTKKKKKTGRPRKLDIYHSDDEEDEDEDLNYGHHFEEEEEEEEEVPLSEEENFDSPNEDEIEEEEEEEEEEGDALQKKRARELPAILFMDDVEVPPLTLPPSSEDLLIKGGQNLMRALSIYEVLRRFGPNLRLTPFRFEDFVVALLIDEQSYLLSEIHIALLKALMREDDLIGTQHGSLDIRDTVNIYLYLCDAMTWPEVTRLYLSSDRKKTATAKLFADSLAVNYPFASLEQKLALLEYFVEEYLTSTNAREALNGGGSGGGEGGRTSSSTTIIKHDDNCRACHRAGDLLLLCCDTCPAVFHLGCLEPPLKVAPAEEDLWSCPICSLNAVSGVSDCANSSSTEPLVVDQRLGSSYSSPLTRQLPIGWDRHGRKYWFLCRRLIVEDNAHNRKGKEEDEKSADQQVYYYTSRLQFDELLAALDAEHYEADLCAALAELKPEISRQMLLTERLTKLAKSGCGGGTYSVEAFRRKSYLELVNEELFLLREGKLKLAIEEAEEGEEKTALQEQLAELQAKLAVDESSNERNIALDGSGGGVLTRLKTGTIPHPKSLSMDSFKSRISSYNNFSVVRGGGSGSDDDSVIYIEEKEEGACLRLTRRPRKTLPSSYFTSVPFKLGTEGNYRQWQNIYSLNKLALNRLQLAEEGDKKRHLSHKFSLTEASELKWTPFAPTTAAHSAPNIYGNMSIMLNILRQTLLNLETQLSLTFMHPNWTTHRINWIKAVAMCSEPKEFLLAMHILESSMKPVLFNIAWHESLGFFVLQRSTQAERDQLKKREKKDRKEGGGNANESMAIDTSEPSSAAGRFNGAGVGIRLVCGKLKHQIWKQKGEEFRLNGFGGWQWISSTRVKPEIANSEKPTRQREDQELPEKDMDTTEQQLTPSVIDISKALSESPTEYKGSKYPKLISSSSDDGKSTSRLDSLLKARLDMYAFDKRQEKEVGAAATVKKLKEEEKPTVKTANTDDSSSITYRCYSSFCQLSSGQPSSQQQLCYSPLCNHQATNTGKEEKKETTEVIEPPPSILDDPTEHVDLLEVKAVGADTVPMKVKKIVPFKSGLPRSIRFSVGPYRSMFILPMYEMRKLGRTGGLCEVTGFNYVCKSNNTHWPYGLTPRPSLRIVWLFRSSCLTTLAAVAHQLRVLWAAVRWDDMLEKPAQPTGSGVKTITTESEVTTVEILRRRDLPPFGLRSQYLVRKIIVPIDLPSNGGSSLSSTRDTSSTPSRSGLRQRKRPASPQVLGPRVEETWLNEEEIELWELRQFAEKAVIAERKRKAEAAAADLAQRRALQNSASSSSTPTSGKSVALVNGFRSTTTPTTGNNSNSSPSTPLNTKQAISSRLSSIFQNRKVLSTSPIINSGTITAGSSSSASTAAASATTTTTYATIRTANGTFRVPVQNRPGGPAGQFILRPGGQLLTTAASSAGGQGGSFIVTPTATPIGRPAAYIVRSPAVIGGAGGGGSIGTARPLILSSFGDGIGAGSTLTTTAAAAANHARSNTNPNIKQAVGLIAASTPQKISTGTRVNAIIKSGGSAANGAPAATPTTTSSANTFNLLMPTTVGGSAPPNSSKGIQCVQLKTSDGRTHLLPISSLPAAAPGQTFQIALNQAGAGGVGSTAASSFRLISTTAAQNNNNKGQDGKQAPQQQTFMISASSSSGGGQKVILQQPQHHPTSSINLTTNPTIVTPSTVASSTSVKEGSTTSDAVAKSTSGSSSATFSSALISKSAPPPAALTAAAAAATSESPEASFELTPEMTQDIVRKALMNASLPHGTSQKLLAFQLHHRTLNKLGGEDGAANKEEDAAPPLSSSSRKNGGKIYATPSSRLLESASGSSSRSNRYSRGKSRYDNNDYITDFRSAGKMNKGGSKGGDEKEEGAETDESADGAALAEFDKVDRECARLLNVLLDKVAKSEKMAWRAEQREKRNQKHEAINRAKFRQSHIEVMRRSIERRKAKLNLGIRLSVEEELNSAHFSSRTATTTPTTTPTTTISDKSGKKRKLKEEKEDGGDGFMANHQQVSPSKKRGKGSDKKAKRPKVTITKSPSSYTSSLPHTNGILPRSQHSNLNGFASTTTVTPSTTTVTPTNTDTPATTSTTNSQHKSVRQIKKVAKSQKKQPLQQPQVISNAVATDSAESSEAAMYCICQKAYDVTKFYICCDTCMNWFHGRCVGITSAVAETIAEYICPQCEGDNSINYRNIKELSSEDYQAMATILKSVQSHVHAKPFLKPVCRKTVFDYYDIIEEPMDLKTIETRLKSKSYKSLAEFIYDMNKIFDNCLIYNGPTSLYYRYAEALKECFNTKLDEFLENES